MLADGYEPPSPLREIAASTALDALAPDNPVAAEMAQVRETLNDLLRKVTPRPYIPPTMRADVAALRDVVERNIGAVDSMEMDILSANDLSVEQRAWAADFRERWRSGNTVDPWGSASSFPANQGGLTEEPPF